ncbi:MAG: EAL domain-containing protein [Oscillospiraceae bacterium]|nr:EAL domain-containing protein [Oscillospiraceae bacterium]
MMLHERPVFALCTAKIHNPEVLESVKAFIDEAKRRSYAVLVFNSSLDNLGDPMSDTNCYSVYDLIPFHIVDMICIMSDVIHDPVVCETITAIAKEHKKPVMAYDGRMDHIPSVYCYSGQAFSKLLDHVFCDHACTRVNLLTGTRGNYGSECMVMAYSEALRKYNIPFDEERVGYGDYWEKSAMEATERFLTKDIPEAIVCINDEMAIAACAVLQSHGLRVPEDVIVTGSDGIIKERFHTPRLTTCIKDYDRLTSVTFDTAELILDGEDVNMDTEITPLLRISESCGCCVTEQRDQNQAIRVLYNQLQICVVQEAAESRLLGSVLQRKQPTVIDYLDVMAEYLPEDSYLCLRDSLGAELTGSSLTQFADTTELMSTVMFKRREKQFAIVPRANLIPDLESVLSRTEALYITAINMQEEVYGYFVYYGSRPDEECFKLPKFIHTAGNVIGSSLATSRLQTMNEKLVAARIRDSLTGMLNQHGAMKMLTERLRTERHENERLVMIVIGLNRLRQINSIFGRNEGDQALLSLANAITDSVDSDVVAARIGGDEFMIAFFDSDVMMNTAEALISVLKKRMFSYNQVSGKSYTMEISFGRVSADLSSSISLDAMLAEAITIKDAQRVNSADSEAKPTVSEAEAAQMERVLNDNLLSYCFQPIVNANNGSIFAYEALMRTAGGVKVSPLTLLSYASGAGRLYEIEWLTYNNVLKYIAANREYFRDKRVFINSIPGHFLNDTDYLKIREMYSDILPKLVVEFTEQAETEGEELRMVQARAEQDHMDIAVDDYGTGYSNITNLLRYSPNYVKIDRSLIASIHEEPKKQHFVTNIIEFAHANGFMALAEGVETVEELRAVIRFGVDLIQGNFTAMPSDTPIEAIPDRIAAIITKFSASAQKQIMQKTYILAGEPTVELPKLDAEHYTDLFISQPYLEIIGDFNETSGVHIKIRDDTDCHLVLRNVHFNLPQQVVAPAIMLGKNCHVTIEFQGDNRMDNGGIYVPESSSLHLTGKGNLSIRADDSKAFAIGNDPDLACGEINIDLAGILTILMNGGQCVGIGAGYGKGQKIAVTGTRLFFEMTGKSGVCIGTLEGDSVISVTGCEADFSLRMASSIAIGSMDGAPNILCNTTSLTLIGSGTNVGGIGSEQGGGNIVLRDTTISAEMTGQNIFVIGSGDSAPQISLRQCNANMRLEGTRALDIGSYNSDADLMMVDSSMNISILSGIALHFAADPEHCVRTGGAVKVAINE